VSRLEELLPNAAVRGVRPDCLVTVVGATWYGSDAVELTYKDPEGHVANMLVYRDDEHRLEVAAGATSATCAGRDQAVPRNSLP
jgi:hypothetical protein